MEYLDNILKLTSDKGIYWSGKDIAEIGIVRGMSYSEVMIKFIEHYLSNSKKTFNVGEINGEANKIMDRDEALKMVVSKINNLTSEDIKHIGLTNGDYISIEASKFINKKFNYNILSNDNGSSISFNLSEGLEQNDVLSTRVVISGRSTTGHNILLDSTEPISSTNVKNENYPIDIDVSIRIKTNKGVVDLEKKMQLVNPAESGSFSTPYIVKDRSNNSSTKEKLSEWVESMASVQKNINAYKDLLQNTKNGDIVDAVNNNIYNINELTAKEKGNSSDIIDQGKKIENINIEIVNISRKTGSIESELKEAQNKLGNISNPSGGGINGTTGENLGSLSTSVV